MSPRCFITFEGIDGSGKTTQVELLKQKLSHSQIEHLAVREPGATAIGEKIRQILLSPESREMTLTAELMLYAAARAQLVSQVIKPALEVEQLVICDRFVHSTMAYQGYGSGYDLDTIKSINDEAVANIRPDLTIVLDVEVEEGFNRCRQGGRGGETGQDRIEQRSLDFYRRVRNGYLTMAREDPRRVVLVSSELGIEEAHAEIRRIINERTGLGL